MNKKKEQVIHEVRVRLTPEQHQWLKEVAEEMYEGNMAQLIRKFISEKRSVKINQIKNQ